MAVPVNGAQGGGVAGSSRGTCKRRLACLENLPSLKRPRVAPVDEAQPGPSSQSSGPQPMEAGSGLSVSADPSPDILLSDGKTTVGDTEKGPLVIRVGEYFQFHDLREVFVPEDCEVVVETKVVLRKKSPWALGQI